MLLVRRQRNNRTALFGYMSLIIYKYHQEIYFNQWNQWIRQTIDEVNEHEVNERI